MSPRLNDLMLEIDSSLLSYISTYDHQCSFSGHLWEQHLLLLQKSHSPPTSSTLLNVKSFPWASPNDHSAHQISELLAAQMNSLSSYFNYYTRRRLLLLILTRLCNGVLIPNVKNQKKKTSEKIKKLGEITLNYWRTNLTII